MNIKQALQYGANLIQENKIEDAYLKAKLLLCHTLNVPKEYLFIHDLEQIPEERIKEYKEYLNRIINGEPIQYIIGKQEFYGINFFVNKIVLIPQPYTEILVEEVINICKQNENSISILDLCTGSGAIGIALSKNLKESNITLSDISEKALEVAKQNANINKQTIKIIQSDLFENINEKFDVIVSNPPYIKTNVIKTLSKEVQNEPILALDGGEDGLEIYKRIINEAHKYLEKEGYLCLEIGFDQKEEVMNLINKNGRYKEIYSKKDLSGNDRIIVCKRGEI